MRRRREQSGRRDLRLAWRSYRAARRNGASVQDSIRFATEELQSLQRTGRIPNDPPPAARVDVEKAEPLGERVISITQALLLNAVTIFGVFGLRWPVGTALALYWTETVLATMSVFLLLTLWRHIEHDNSHSTAGELVQTSFIFSAAHLVFLVVFLVMILPRYAPADRFERTSFEVGLLCIGAIVFADFAIHAIAIRFASEEALRKRAELDMQRVAILHLTIVFGMFALALFGSARAFFAVFSALKTLADLMRRSGA